MPFGIADTSVSKTSSKITKWATGAVAVVALLFAAAGAAETARAEFVIGVGVTSNGLKAQEGQEIRSSAEREILRINAAGGIDGESVQLVVEDDGCTAEGGARVAASFVRQRAALVLGHPCSNSAIAAAKTYALAGVWFVAIGAGHPDLTIKRAGATIFRLGGRDDRQAGDTVATLLANFWGKRIAIVHDRTAFARSLADGVARGLKAAEQPAIAMDGIIAGKMHYKDLAGRIKSGRVDAIYFAGFPNEYDILRSDLKEAGVAVQIVACDAAATGAMAGESALRLLEPHDALDGSRVFMVRRTGFATGPAELVLAVLGAFQKSARNLTAFTSLLEVDTGGDSQNATFVPALKPCASGDCP